MAKGDANQVQSQINNQGGIAQNNINNLWGQNTNRSTNFQNLYQGAVGQNQGNYNDVMNSLKTFLGNKYQPKSDTATGPAGPTAASVNDSLYAPTGDPNKDAVLALYKKYGVTPGASGSGLSDLSYWSGDAVNNANGDTGYTLGRLESDLQGNGPDATGPGDKANGIAGAGRGGAIDSAISGYQNFANTGGFSPEDIANIRARSVAPIRGIQDNTTREIQRQEAIRGAGNSPNAIAALAKANRDSAYATGDVAQNAEASIAQLKQQGKLYGLGGLANTGLTDQGQQFGNTNTNRSLDLGGVNAMTSLYGTTPGLANMFGNQVLASGAQGIQTGGLQNQLASIIMQGQLGKSGVPGSFQSGLGNTSSSLGFLGSLAKFFGGFGGNSDNSSPWDANGNYTGFSTYGSIGGGTGSDGNPNHE